MARILYGLSISTRGDYNFEEAWTKAGINYTLYSVGGGSVEYRFPTVAEKATAREIAARILIADFDVED